MTQRLIFCINSGRSGSEYLAHLLDTAAHTDGVHENRPSMHGYYLEPTLHGPMADSFEFRRDKERAIWPCRRAMPLSLAANTRNSKRPAATSSSPS
jgi:hypothetical protein